MGAGMGAAIPQESHTKPAPPRAVPGGNSVGIPEVLPPARSPRGLSRSPWAVKKINSGCSQSQRSLFQQRLREEAETLRNLQHPNIVGYRALTEAPDGSLCLAMEFAGEKSLNDLIEERREQGLGMFPADTILHVALSMARGLQYLHTEQRLLHGDIKSPNVVVRGAFEAVKICDVGVSLPLDENLTVSDPSLCYVGTEPWLPPEALAPGAAISDRADVFAFGLTLWEMLALSVPHLPPAPGGAPDDDDVEDEDSEEDSEDSWDEAAFRAALGSRPALPAAAAREPAQAPVRELFCACTAAEPRRRPPAARVARALESRQRN
ncbi:lymphokine-activated killer T-cell-originated protein kinase-like [Anomalospiza imberbis]|uniref:lymphokine-activated killer T-cell-originated protein kinase-like n=1 Tax=Anomalospiza imberbis TaxID=187417 RepID=UPI00358FF9DF